MGKLRNLIEAVLKISKKASSFLFELVAVIIAGGLFQNSGASSIWPWHSLRSYDHIIVFHDLSPREIV